MKINTEGRIVLFSIMTIILMQFVSVYHLQITHAASSCGCGGGSAVAVGAAPAVSPGVSAGISFNSIEVEFCDLDQYKETLENKVDRFELLQMSAKNMNIPTENPIIWVIM
jgi:hypothetical protein